LRTVQKLISLCRLKRKPVLIDPKGSDFSRYAGATLITPNLSEFEVVAGSCVDEDDLVEKGRQLCKKLELSALLITRSEHGMTLIENDEARHLPTQAREVYDVTGAGDTVISTLAAALASGQSTYDATSLANIAAGIVVGKSGTAAVSVDEIKQEMRKRIVVPRGIISEAALLDTVSTCQHHGERIVMTNGCFDILHAGHVTYLQQARELGDRLVVAVNVDETVRRLKGADRPVNNVDYRMLMLSALECVDWVVPFTEDTPTRLICEMKPDILVKGGDNDPDKIPGAECVRKNGGEVKVLSYIDGVSTTSIIQNIRSKGPVN
jgi:D-beta-D-heptose 7-phosphate kinase / D-beta-D-heptose 1-phosphate adenosyltransferase